MKSYLHKFRLSEVLDPRTNRPRIIEEKPTTVTELHVDYCEEMGMLALRFKTSEGKTLQFAMSGVPQIEEVFPESKDPIDGEGGVIHGTADSEAVRKST